MSEVQALLFDLGGVLIALDFDRIVRSWAEKANCEAEEIRDRFHLDAPYERHERGEIDASEYFATLRNSLGISLSDADFLAGWNDVFIDPIVGIEPLLRAASQTFPLYVFTNSNPAHQRIWTERLRRELTWFESVFVSSELGLRKPDPAAFAEVARRVGRPASHFAFFDDTPENVAGAEDAGMRGVVVRSPEDVRTALRQLGVKVP